MKIPDASLRIPKSRKYDLLTCVSTASPVFSARIHDVRHAAVKLIVATLIIGI